MKILNVLAQNLDKALLEGKTMPRLTLEHPELTLDQAYDIQEFGIKSRLARGETLLGYKMGLTSLAKMEQMGLRNPIYGVLTDQMRLEHGATLPLSKWVQAKIEPEIAFKFTKDLRGNVTESDVLEACQGVAPALEILDSRFVGFKYFSLPDVVADNSSSASFVTGPRWIPLRELPSGSSISNLKIQLIINGNSKALAVSSDVLGNPVRSIMELCRLLSARDLYLKAGSLVLSGAATQAFALEPGMTVSAVIETLGEVSINISEKISEKKSGEENER